MKTKKMIQRALIAAGTVAVSTYTLSIVGATQALACTWVNIGGIWYCI
jgi:hypothetical protein